VYEFVRLSRTHKIFFFYNSIISLVNM